MGIPLDGHEIAARLRAELAPLREACREAGKTPRLVAVRIGDGPTELDALRREAEAWNIEVHEERFPTTVRTTSMRKALAGLARDSSVHGLMFVGAPPRDRPWSTWRLALSPPKDVAALHPETLLRLLEGRSSLTYPLAEAVSLLARAGLGALEGQRAFVLGPSGPGSALIASRLTAAGLEVTLHTDLAGARSIDADLVVVGGSRAEGIGAEHVSPDATVIDLGVHAAPGGARLVGNVRYDEVLERAAHVTPVPGGVWPVRDAVLLANVVRATRGGGPPDGGMPLFAGS